MHLIKFLTVVAIGSASIASAAGAVTLKPSETQFWQPADSKAQEAWIEEPTPPGIQVVPTPLDGPVYADAEGRTL